MARSGNRRQCTHKKGDLPVKIKGALHEHEIAQAVDAAATELERAGIEDKLRLIFRLALEEILLLYRERSSEDTPFSLRFRKRNGDFNVRLIVGGEAFNPFEQDSVVLRKIGRLHRFRNMPAWRFEKGENRILFVFTLYNTTVKNLLFSWKYTVNSRKTLGFSVFCQIISAVMGIVAPAISARIIIAYTHNEAHRVIYIALALLGVQLLRNLFLVLANMGYNRAYTRTLSALEKDLVANVLQIESQCLDEKGSGLFIQRITGDTGRIASGFNNIADMITQVLNYFGVLCAMFLVNPSIAILVVLIMGSQCVMELWRTKRLYRDDRIFRTANERFSGLVGEMVRGAKDVRLLNSEGRFSEELNGRIEEANSKRLTMQNRSWYAKLFRWEFGEVGTFALIALLTWLISRNLILPSIALVFYNYYAELGPNAVKIIGNFMDSIADFNISNERVHALLNSPEFPKERFGSTELASPRGEIQFDHVSFSYDPDGNRKVLNDLCFTIHAGEMVGLVGKSGCGKTTTFNLISKLYEATGGRVMLDGIDIRELTRESIRNNMSVITQNPYIFRMSIRDNLKIVKEDMTDEEMEQVCRMACIDEDIRSMPNGYDTLIGEGGVNLSGGQRQRLSIARCMLRDSRIILMDEATSALDNATQAKIQQAIDNMRRGRTVVIIAHRLSTIAEADRILFMKDGRILTEGTHRELLSTCEAYQSLAAMDRSGENGNPR